MILIGYLLKKKLPNTNTCSMEQLYHYRISVSMEKEGGERGGEKKV